MALASAVRSKVSARKAKAMLCIVHAEDEIVSPWSESGRDEVRTSVMWSNSSHIQT